MSSPETHIVAPAPPDVRSVSNVLKRRLRTLFSRNGHRGTHVVRIAVPVPETDPFAWLAAQPFAERSFWSARERSGFTAAVGAADAVAGEGWPCMELPLLEAPGGERLRYFGGMRFDPASAPSPLWSSFTGYRFVLPRFELQRGADGAMHLTCNVVLPADRRREDALLGEVDALAWPDQLDEQLPLPSGRADAPGRAEWIQMTTEALGCLADDDLEKVVLARQASYRFDEELPAYAMLRSLASSTPSCFHFAFQFGDDALFLGATPERLLRLRDGVLSSEAVAGTRPRSSDRQTDDRLRRELLESEKDRREHAFVLDRIRETFGQIGSHVRVDASPGELRLARSRHLYAALETDIPDETDPFYLLEHLHPTPAVGGTPAEEAIASIRRWEPFDRGWYAGPVGWVSRDEAEFAVAIRSGLVSGDTLHLYSGAGIVEGSDPEAEWDEIEHKISSFTHILGLEER